MAKQSKTVDELVEAVLGKRAETMSAKERGAAVRAFIDAGKGAVQARTGNLRDAAEAVRRGKRLLAEGRAAMADASKPGGPATVPDRAWGAHRRALREHRDSLVGRKNVIGASVGYRWRGGAKTDERVVVVYVQRKESPEELSKAEMVPENLTAGKKRVGTDVVELGTFVRQIDAGGSVGPQGTELQGTLGVFAKDRATGSVVGLTAMHVTGRPGPFPPGAQLTLCAPSGGPVLGRLLRGESDGVDAAAVLVTPPASGSGRIERIGKVRGRRPLSQSGDSDAEVRIHGAQSGLLSGFIREISVDLDFPDGPIGAAILVEMETDLGDSGAALVDEGKFVLGILAGRFEGLEGLAVFSPIMPVLKALKCEIRPT